MWKVPRTICKNPISKTRAEGKKRALSLSGSQLLIKNTQTAAHRSGLILQRHLSESKAALRHLVGIKYNVQAVN